MILPIPWMPFLDDAQRWTSFSLCFMTFISLCSSALLFFFQLVEYPFLLLLVRSGLFLVTYDGWLLKPTGSFWLDIGKIVFVL